MNNVAVILSGGKGTRLYPYTVSLPKPLLPVGDKPILEIIIKQLKEAGFSKVILAVNHQADIIMSYFGDGDKFGLDIAYSLENTPLGTMAPLKSLKALPEQFLVMNGDVLTDLDYEGFFEGHKQSGADFTVSACKTTQKSQFGVIDIDATNQVIGFQEKPEINLIVSMGIYGMGANALSLIPENKPFGFDDLMRVGLAGNLVIKASLHNGYWRDLGTPEDYQKANDEVNRQGVSKFL